MPSKYHQPPIPYVDHVHIYVQNIERSLAFYQELMGLSILSQEANKIEFTTDGRTPILTVEVPEGVQPKLPHTTGLYHFAILLPTRKDLALFFRHLLMNRVQLQGGSDHGFSEALYFSDPDGNGIEVYADKPDDLWEWENGQVKGNTTYLEIESLMELAGDDFWQGMPEGTLMGHIHLHVDDLLSADRFYLEGLGLDLTMRYPGQASFYSWGKYHHHIAVNVWNGRNASKPNPLSVGLHEYAIQYSDVNTLNETVERLKRLGYDVTQGENGWLIVDPAGNRINLRLV